MGPLLGTCACTSYLSYCHSDDVELCYYFNEMDCHSHHMLDIYQLKLIVNWRTFNSGRNSSFTKIKLKNCDWGTKYLVIFFKLGYFLKHGEFQWRGLGEENIVALTHKQFPTPPQHIWSQCSLDTSFFE